MQHGRSRVFLVAPLLLMTLFLAGCPKRPATTAASAVAPAPSAPAVTPAPAPPSTGGSTGAATPAPSPPAPATAAPATPPRPSEFSANAALKDIYFDFDKYDIRPSDAKVLDDNAGWLKANDT